MKQTKNIMIMVVVIGVVLIILGGILMFIDRIKIDEINTNYVPSPSPTTSLDTSIDSGDDKDSTDGEIVIISKEDALNIIKNIYAIDGWIISFKEDIADFYVFEQKNSELVVSNIFKFNKVTGEIIKESIPVDMPSQ